MKALIAISCLVLLSIARAERVDGGKIVTGAIMLVLGSGNPLGPQDHVGPNTLGGRCDYHGSGCSGATVMIYSPSGLIYESRLTSGGLFKFDRVSANETFKLVLSWKAHQIERTLPITSGKFLSINLVDKTADQ